jgi:hypothetical protein
MLLPLMDDHIVIPFPEHMWTVACYLSHFLCIKNFRVTHLVFLAILLGKTVTPPFHVPTGSFREQ